MLKNRVQFCQTDLDSIFKVLKKRFISDIIIIIKKFNKSRLRLKDVAEDLMFTGRFVQRLLCLFKDIGIFIENRSNWINIVIIIWNKIDLEIYLVLYILSLLEQLTDFIQYIEKAKYLVVRFACNYINQ